MRTAVAMGKSMARGRLGDGRSRRVEQDGCISAARARSWLAITGTEVTKARLPETVLLPAQRPGVDQNVINTFCHYIYLFASPTAASEWTPKHDGTFTISLAEGTEIARHTNRGRYPSIFRD
jgi:hypothetical protein